MESCGRRVRPSPQPSPRGRGSRIPIDALAALTLPSRALQHRAGGIADVQFRGAFAAQPNHHARGVDPIKGGHFFSHLHGFGSLQALQSLDKKHPVVPVPVGSVFSMYAFSFKHKLLLHKEGPSSHAAPRELRYFGSKQDPSGRVLICIGGEKQGKTNQKILYRCTPQAHNAMPAPTGQPPFEN